MYKLGKYKLRKIGGSTVLTIPPIWLENHGVKLGTYVEISEGDAGELIVTLKPVG